VRAIWQAIPQQLAKENKKEGPLEKGISDRVKIFSIIASSGLAILAVNLIIIKAKRKKQK